MMLLGETRNHLGNTGVCIYIPLPVSWIFGEISKKIEVLLIVLKFLFFFFCW